MPVLPERLEVRTEPAWPLLSSGSCQSKATSSRWNRLLLGLVSVKLCHYGFSDASSHSHRSEQAEEQPRIKFVIAAAFGAGLLHCSLILAQGTMHSTDVLHCSLPPDMLFASMSPGRWQNSGFLFPGSCCAPSVMHVPNGQSVTALLGIHVTPADRALSALPKASLAL